MSTDSSHQYDVIQRFEKDWSEVWWDDVWKNDNIVQDDEVREEVIERFDLSTSHN